jgi:NitT/TauT family transport system substrate-binding protein
MHRPAIAVSLFLMFAVAACGGAAQSSEAPAQPSEAAATQPVAASDSPDEPRGEVVVLRVGSIAPRLANLPSHVAADMLAEEGIVIQWVYFESDGAVSTALAAGAIDMATNSPQRAEQLNEAGGDTRVFATMWGTLDWLLVARDGIETLEDLPGTTVAISSPGSTTDLLTRELLEPRGLSPEEDGITLAAIGGTGARASALLAGSADVAWLGYDAAYTLLEENDGFHVLEDMSVGSEFPGYISQMWTADADYIAEHPDVILAITKAQIEANRWAQDEDAFVARAQESIVAFIGEQTEEQIRWAHERYVDTGLFPVDGGVTPEAMEITMELTYKAGSIEDIPAYEEIADDSFQKQVLEEIGPYEG